MQRLFILTELWTLNTWNLWLGFVFWFSNNAIWWNKQKSRWTLIISHKIHQINIYIDVIYHKKMNTNKQKHHFLINRLCIHSKSIISRLDTWFSYLSHCEIILYYSVIGSDIFCFKKSLTNTFVLENPKL